MTTFATAVQNTPALSFTDNGMVTLDHSGDPATTLFFAIGSSRGKNLNAAFARAYASEPDVAMKILFWARDARDGAGERDTFRKLLQNLEVTATDSLIKNLFLIPEFGRFDDLLVFNTNKVKMAAYDIYVRALRAGNGLAAKWAPRKGPVANDLRKYLNFTPKAYRQLIVSLSNTVETQMCAGAWDQINYEHVPSVASGRYMKAFTRHDGVRYVEWKQGLKTGATKVNAAVLYPYDVLKSLGYGDREVALAQWQALPNYLGDDKILPMVDVSGSMSCGVGGQRGVGLTCMDVAVSLGLYIADKQTGAFQDCFLNFSDKCKIQVLRGDLLSKMSQMQRSDWGMSTSLESGFREILRVATENNLPASEMPRYLLVFSDMEFNAACREGRSVGAFDLANKMFTDAGYQCPAVVWWNLNARSDAHGNAPVRFDQTSAALVSGFSPAILKSILSAKAFTPRSIMMETIGSEKYQVVTA